MSENMQVGAWYNVTYVKNAAKSIVDIWNKEHAQAFNDFCKKNEHKQVKVKKSFFCSEMETVKRTDSELLDLWHSHIENSHWKFQSYFEKFRSEFEIKHNVFSVSGDIVPILSMCHTNVNNDEIYLTLDVVSCFGDFLKK